MLEFIVLGQIPGTGFVITFGWIVGLITVATGVGLLRYEHKHHDLMQLVSIEETAL